MTDRPINIAAVVGEMADFSCVSSEVGKIRWDFYEFGQTKIEHVWKEDTLKPPFLLNTTQCKQENRCDVMVKVMPNSSGSFVCREHGKSSYYLATLTVLGEIGQFVQPSYTVREMVKLLQLVNSEPSPILQFIP